MGALLASAIITSVSQLLAFNYISLGVVTDNYFLSTGLVNLSVLLITSAIQNGWLAKLSQYPNEVDIKNFINDGNILVVLSSIIILLISVILFYFDYLDSELGLYLTLPLFPYYIIHINNFQNFLVFYGRNENFIVEKVELVGSIVFSVCLFLVVITQSYFLLSIPILSKSVVVFILIYNRKNVKIKLPKFQLGVTHAVKDFLKYNSLTKINYIERVLMQPLGESVLSIFSIWDSISNLLSRIYWRGFGLTLVPVWMKLNHDKLKPKINKLFKFSFITICIISGLLIMFSLFELKIPFDLFKIKPDLVTLFWLSGASLMSVVLFHTPISLVQNILFSKKEEKFVIKVDLYLYSIGLGLKVLLLILHNFQGFLLVLCLQKIITYTFIQRKLVSKKGKLENS